MAAAQVAGTPAAPAAEITTATHGLDDVLADLAGVSEDAPQGIEGAVESLLGEEAPAEQETPEAEPAKEQPGSDTTLDEMLFSDEALATPEGVKKAATRLRDLRHKQREAYLGLKGYEKNVVAKAGKLKAKVNEFRSEKQTHQLLIDNVRSNLQGLHSSDPEVILTALGNLTGTDGVKAYELLTSRIVNRGQSKLDPQVQALLDRQQQQIEELRTGYQTRALEVEIQQKTQAVEGHKARLGEVVRASTTTPHLTRLFNENPARLTQAIVDAITEDNGATPAGALFAQMEAELTAHLGPAPQGTSGGAAPKQPQRAQRSPGQSVGASTAAAATRREPTEEERLRAIADDDDFMRGLLG